MTVREALQLLTAEGVMTYDPDRGFFVTPLSSDEPPNSTACATCWNLRCSLR
jgi:DNA-binding GntR family transcriptional regulator